MDDRDALARQLAVQAIEQGARFEPPRDGWMWQVGRSPQPFEAGLPCGVCPTLSEAAARALLAVHNGGTT